MLFLVESNLEEVDIEVKKAVFYLGAQQHKWGQHTKTFDPDTQHRLKMVGFNYLEFSSKTNGTVVFEYNGDNAKLYNKGWEQVFQPLIGETHSNQRYITKKANKTELAKANTIINKINSYNSSVFDMAFVRKFIASDTIKIGFVYTFDLPLTSEDTTLNFPNIIAIACDNNQLELPVLQSFPLTLASASISNFPVFSVNHFNLNPYVYMEKFEDARPNNNKGFLISSKVNRFVNSYRKFQMIQSTSYNTFDHKSRANLNLIL